MNHKLTIALTKGRILLETLPLLAKAGIVPIDDISKSRKLAFETNLAGVTLLVLRGSDVPTYVQYGAADIGVAGKDTLLESGTVGIYEPLDLGIARCRLMTAGLTGVAIPQGRIRVATKYVNVARRYYAETRQQVDLIKLYGAMELAPVMGLVDEIIDIVDTGNTLKANGLESRVHIADISSRLIVNATSMKVKHSSIGHLVSSIKNAVVTNH